MQRAEELLRGAQVGVHTGVHSSVLGGVCV